MEAEATPKRLPRNQWAMVLQWALVALDVAAASEAASMAVGASSEVVAVVHVAVADVSVIVATVHPMEHPQVLVLAVDMADATEAVASMTVARAAMLTLSLYHLEEAIAAETVVVTDTATATVIAVGMLARSDLTKVVGMTSRGHDAAIERLCH